MTDDQQWVAAADMLTGARSADGGDDLPSDSLVDEFQAGVTEACVIPSMKLAEIGAGLYLTERTRFRP